MLAASGRPSASFSARQEKDARCLGALLVELADGLLDETSTPDRYRSSTLPGDARQWITRSISSADPDALFGVHKWPPPRRSVACISGRASITELAAAEAQSHFWE
jgi:hypothetical protein